MRTKTRDHYYLRSGKRRGEGEGSLEKNENHSYQVRGQKCGTLRGHRERCWRPRTEGGKGHRRMYDWSVCRKAKGRLNNLCKNEFVKEPREASYGEDAIDKSFVVKGEKKRERRSWGSRICKKNRTGWCFDQIRLKNEWA